MSKIRHPGYYNDINCDKLHKRPKNYIFDPAPHQIYVRDYFLDSPHKGLLLYHKLGSGKSCTSIMVADALLKSKKVDKIFVLTPGSLRKNWVSEYCRVCGSIEEKDFMKVFTFITYNYKIEKNLSQYDFNNSLVIIDECHNLLNGVKNKSVNTTSLYNKILYSNARVLLLSGTPIIQGKLMEEWKNYSLLLDEGRSQHYNDENKIPDKILQGIISYYPGDPTKYPEVRIKPIQKIPMTDEQYNFYKKAYEKEAKLRSNGPPKRELFYKNKIIYFQKLQAFIKATKYLTTRMYSNCFYGDKIKKKVEKKIKEVDKTGNVDKFDEDKNDIKDATDEDLKEDIDDKEDYILLPDKYNKDGGWISKESLSDQTLLKISPKFSWLLLNIVKHLNSKHVIYSFYKTRSGVQLLCNLLKHCGLNAAIFSGDVPSKTREEILNKFNDKNNRRGDKIKVLLITDAGSEGINVLECNNIHIVESGTKENRTRQAIGRVIRYKSHINLPKNKQYVNVWRYWSTNPHDKKIKEIDEILYKKGIDDEKKCDLFVNKLIKNCIENERL
jgi:superfamily II DNA or RNA helicase